MRRDGANPPAVFSRIILLEGIMTDISKEQIHQQILKTMRKRIARIIDVPEGDLNVSLGHLINILFLLEGEHQSVGEFWPSFSAVHKLIGRELLWAEPEAEKPAEAAPFVQ
jgi:hypothetical protein